MKRLNILLKFCSMFVFVIENCCQMYRKRWNKCWLLIWRHAIASHFVCSTIEYIVAHFQAIKLNNPLWESNLWTYTNKTCSRELNDGHQFFLFTNKTQIHSMFLYWVSCTSNQQQLYHCLGLFMIFIIYALLVINEF